MEVHQIIQVIDDHISYWNKHGDLAIPHDLRNHHIDKQQKGGYNQKWVVRECPIFPGALSGWFFATSSGKQGWWGYAPSADTNHMGNHRLDRLDTYLDILDVHPRL